MQIARPQPVESDPTVEHCLIVPLVLAFITIGNSVAELIRNKATSIMGYSILASALVMTSLKMVLSKNNANLQFMLTRKALC